MMETLIQKICMKLAVIAIFGVCTNNAVHHNLVVPSAPVIGSVGHDIILPCHLSPVASAVAMEIRWFREVDFINYLYLYQPPKSSEGKGYEGRVSLFTQELERGNISLLLKDLTMSDQGRYKCQASHLEWVQEEAIDLQITQQGTVPMITLVKFQRESLKLSCRSHSWAPGPQLVWMDRTRKEIVSEKTEQTETIKDGIFFSVTSYLTLVNHQPEEVFCVVSSQDRKSKLESGIQITEEFYTKSVFERTYLSAFLIPIFFGLVSVTASLLYALHERKMSKEKLQPLSECKDELEKARNELKQKDDELLQEKVLMNIVGYIPQPVWELMHTHAANVILDQDTAHPQLKVSEDGKTVAPSEIHTPKKQVNYFEDRICVLGKTGYDTGRHYWEIDLEEKTQWKVGVAQSIDSGSVDNKWGNVQLYPDEGYWCISFNKDNKKLETCDQSPTSLPFKLKPEKLGVFLDCEGHTITFFNVETKCCIHSFHSCDFKKNLYPFFDLSENCKKKLTILT